MRRTTLFALLLFSAVSSFAAVTGVIVGDDSAPLAGVRVRAFAREPFGTTAARLLSSAPDPVPLSTTQTDANGAFSLDAKGNAAIDIVADAAGRDPVASSAADGDDAGVIVLRTSDTARRVRVVADGKPLPNALVYHGRSLVVRTDAQGTYAPAVTGEPTFIIHPDFGVVSGGNDKELVLRRGAALRGRVLGRDGKTPVAGATILAGAWPLARSGDDGTFTIAHAPWRVRALLAVTADDAGAAPYDASKPIEIRLGTAGSLSGSVTAKGDAPIAGATVTLATDADRFSAVTDAKGRYAIAALPAGSYFAVVYQPAYVNSRVNDVRVAPAATRAFSLAARPRVRGTILTDDRKPAAGAFVSVAGVIIGGGNGTVVGTGPAGEFTLRLPAGNAPLLVAATKSGYATAVAGPYTLEAGETKSGVTMTLQRGFPLKVKVTDADKTPVAGAAIDLMHTADDDSRVRHSIPCSVTAREKCRLTGADGTVEMRLAEGKYDVQVSGDFVSKTLPAQALTARSSPLLVTVDRGADVSGRVLFDDGTPVAEARITSRTISLVSATTDAAGAFTIHRLPRTPVTIMVVTSDEPPLQSAPVNVTAPARNVTITLPTPSRIEGRVVDRATTAPVPSFSILPMRRDGAFTGRGIDFNNADGSFVLKRIQPGSIELRVTAPGYVAGTLSDVIVEEGKALTGIEVKLDRGARITGHVTARGAAVAGVNVRPDSRNVRRIGQAAMTDANGDYTLDGIAAGEQTLDFMKQGFVTKRKSIEVTAGKDARVDVELDRGREINGRVSERGGQGIAGARVAVSSPASPYAASATSDAEGQFTISGLEDGRYKVSVQKSGFVGASVDDVDAASGRPIVLTLDHGGSITGRVVGVPEAEMAQVRVSASGQNTTANQQVDASGSFTLTGIPDGRVTVMAYKYGAQMRQSAQKVVDVVSGSAPPVEIDFGAGISIRGRVTRMGAPVIGGSVSFSPRSGQVGRMPTSMVGPDGTYEVNGVEPGEYDVRVFVNGGGNDAVRYTVVGNATFDIDLRGGTIRGVVLDAATGGPLPEARVFIVPSREMRTSRNAVSDSNGRFALDLVPDGTMDVRVDREHYAPATESVTVSGGTAAPLEIRLTRGLEAIVRIVDAQSGAPLDGSVALLDAQKKSVGMGNGRGEDGATHIWAAAGRYTARAFVNGYISQTVDVVVPGPEVRVAMSRAAKLVLTSRSGGKFRIVPPTIPGAPGRIFTAFNVPVGERFPFESLAPGVYEVDKMEGDGTTVSKKYTVVLTAGQTTTLDAD